MKVILSTKAHLQYKYYVDLIDYEISGVGLVEKKEGGVLYVTELFLLHQTVTGTETKLLRDDVIKFINEKMDDPNFPMEKLRLWWHSHVNMDTFWSGTDNATIEGLDLDLPEENWWLSIVANKSGKRLARIDTYAPFRLTAHNIDIQTGEDLTLMEQIADEIEQKVKIFAPVSNLPIYGSQGQVLNGANLAKQDDEEKKENYSLAGASYDFRHTKKNKNKHKKWKN